MRSPNHLPPTATTTPIVPCSVETSQLLDSPPTSHPAPACATSPTIAYTSTSFRRSNGHSLHKNTYTHNFHWYPAKLFPQIPAQLLDFLHVRPGTVVLDPFCGSGTVLVEAAARQCLPIGFDINPIARQISRAKTTALSKDRLETLLTSILQLARTNRDSPPVDRLPPYWFTQPARFALYRLHMSIIALVKTPPYADFFLTSLTSITRRCSLADPFIPPPVRMRPHRFQIAGPRYENAYQRAMSLDIPTIYGLFEAAAQANITRLTAFASFYKPYAQVSSASALAMPLPSRSVDVAITSPPYCGAQKYIRTFRLELLLLGFSPQQINRLDHASLGSEKSFWSKPHPSPLLTPQQSTILQKIMARNTRRARMFEIYLHGLHTFVAELERVLKPGAHVFVTLGRSHFSQIPVDLADCFLQFAQRYAYSLEARFTDHIPTRLMITKRSATANVIPSEQILWLRKTQ